MKALFIFHILFILLMTACTTLPEHNTNTPEGAFKQAGEYEKYERYDEAIDRFQNVKKTFPYSSYAKLSDLKVADINFKRESYIEAQAAYQLYRDFYPKDEKIDYVIFQIGMSYYKQLPSAVGRDLSIAYEAIRVFKELQMMYPNSQYIKKAKELQTSTIKLLAQKQLYIADFYFKQKDYLSALGRYEDMLKEFSNVGYNKRALYGAALSAARSKNKSKALQYAEQLNKLFADSTEAKKIQKELRK